MSDQSDLDECWSLFWIYRLTTFGKETRSEKETLGISLTRCTLYLENIQYNAVGYTLLSVVALSVCCLHSSLTFCIPAF